ncbi:PTS system cellobiose-specific IIB component [Sporomusaceae bacterium BoRhaA]|uniref:PTS sugar transporter subunit IIB n=1 Tax=Pelorhabdus rhamnosifermentans TaxID=2772457 RepID=UPI001C05F2AB|nr:PTS sugar transporter subunit IIB [Pelorhabdus rhamnosifermentans]MBU2699721.1 PTS system cellobiose-specific IIB component [Pelorhabdus rhamnosifermentans]
MNIILVCASGMSTSLLVDKMVAEGERRGLKGMHVFACSIDELQDYIDRFDVVLIGPQLRYREKDVAVLAKSRGKKYSVINLMSYGMMDGRQVLDQALNMLQ